MLVRYFYVKICFEIEIHCIVEGKIYKKIYHTTDRFFQPLRSVSSCANCDRTFFEQSFLAVGPKNNEAIPLAWSDVKVEKSI